MPDIYMIYANVSWWSRPPQAHPLIRVRGKSWALRLSILAHELGKWRL